MIFFYCSRYFYYYSKRYLKFLKKHKINTFYKDEDKKNYRDTNELKSDKLQEHKIYFNLEKIQSGREILLKVLT